MERAATEFEFGLPGPGKGRSKWDVVLDVRKAIDAALAKHGNNNDLIWLLTLKQFKQVAQPMGIAVHLRYRAELLTPDQWRERYDSGPHARRPRGRTTASDGKYRFVTQKDVLQAGDEYHNVSLSEWKEIELEDVGRLKSDVFWWFEKVRRVK